MDGMTGILKHISLKKILLVLIIGIVPFVIKVVVAPLGQSEIGMYGFESYADIFTHGKSILFILLTLIGAGVLVTDRIVRRRWEMPKRLWPVMILMVLIFLGGLLSPYFPVPLTGAPERYESMWVHLGYLVLFCMVISTIKEPKDSWLIEWLLVIQLILMGLICLGQFYGFNLLNWEPVRILITGEALARQYPVIALESKLAYGTSGNPGNLAQYCSFIVPLLVSITLTRPANKVKLVALALGWFCVLGSGAGSAILGAGAGTLSAVIFLRFQGVQLSKRFLLGPIIGGFLMALPGVAEVMNGENLIIALTLLALGLLSQRRNPSVVFDSPRGRISGALGGMLILVIGILLISQMFRQEEFIKMMTLSEENLVMQTIEGSHEVCVTDGSLLFKSMTGDQIPYSLMNGIVQSENPGINGLEYGVEVTTGGALLTMHRTGMRFRILQDGLRMLDLNGRPTEVQNPKTFGFQGLGSLFSCRGYIWSRSIPLLFVNPLLGTGSDTFVLVFPQGDYAGKFNMFGTPYMLIDKPHSFYLQYGIQQGLAALFILAGITVIAMGRGMKEIRSLGIESWRWPYLPALLGFLTAAIFNDSLVQTTIYMWVALGVLYSSNSTQKKA